MLDWISKLIHIETIFFIFIVAVIVIFVFTRDPKYISQPLERMLGLDQERPVFEIDRQRSLPAVLASPISPKRAPRPSPPSFFRQTPKAKAKKKINYHEEKCRSIFEKLFRQKFPTVRPDWLENPTTGYNLELDGFCEHIKTPVGTGLAFEYDGIEHAKFSEHFHRNGVAEFEYQIVKDKWKDVQCKARGVLLIRIPHYVTEYDLEPYIRSELESKGMKV